MADDSYIFPDIVVPSVFLMTLCGIITVTCVSLFIRKRNNKSRNEVIVFTRYPVAGKAKTRLIPSIGESGAAGLQVQLTEHIIKNLQHACRNGKNMSVALQYNGGLAEQMKYWFDRKLHGLQCSYLQQYGDNLGAKLRHAVQSSFDRGNRNVIVIGADIPGINESHIEEAMNKLNHQNTNMVIGKAEDGGYYLIGFTTAAKVYLDSVFEEIDWGTGKVFQQQCNRAKTVGASVSVLKSVLQDVDTEEDIPVFEREVHVKRQELQNPKWSIILPVLNEEDNIKHTLNTILKNCSNINNLTDIVVSDGGSKDKTVEYVQEFSRTSAVPVNIVHSKPGRGHQLISGADVAKGDNLLFVHADCVLPSHYDTAAAECLKVPGNVAGAFEFQLDILVDDTLKCREPWWFILQMRALVSGTKLRSQKAESPYGDQGIFMSRRTYEEVGGFPPYYLMEDYILVEKLKTIGHIGITKGYAMTTSYRRWKKHGYVKVTGMNSLIILAYKVGVHPNTLAKWYYGDKLKTK